MTRHLVNPLVPTPEAAVLAEEALNTLGNFLENPPEHVTLSLVEPELGGATITMPGAVFRLLVDVLKHVKDGHPITILPTQAELTTQQAADILDVSRPYLVKLLDEGKIPSRKVGVYRRVLAADVLRYKQTTDRLRQEALDELVKEGQDLGMGY